MITIGTAEVRFANAVCPHGHLVALPVRVTLNEAEIAETLREAFENDVCLSEHAIIKENLYV